MLKRFLLKLARRLAAVAWLVVIAGQAFAGQATYTYDAANRLIFVTDNGAVTHYVYDAVGNLLERRRPLTVSPASKNFGLLLVGSTSPAESFTVTNTGSVPMTFDSVGLTGMDASSFVLTNGCAGVLAPSSSCIIQAAFAPVTVGAKTSNIMIQFIIEAVTLSVVGGAIGIAIGVGGATAIDSVLPTKVTSWSILLAFGFSAAVGIFFGVYPAWKAARLEPIVALRYE